MESGAFPFLVPQQQYQIGYRFSQRTFYNRHHVGLDLWVPRGSWVLAPFDGGAVKKTGPEIGRAVLFYPDNMNVVIRFLHLMDWVHLGHVDRGTIIGYSGNTGESTRPHVHVDISRGSVQPNNFLNFINPEAFDWNATLDMLIRSPGLEVSYVSPNGIRHALSEDSYHRKFDASPFRDVSQQEYDRFPVGESI